MKLTDLPELDPKEWIKNRIVVQRIDNGREQASCVIAVQRGDLKELLGVLQSPQWDRLLQCNIIEEGPLVLPDAVVS